MAETSKTLFYNSENGDRVYDADSFEHLLKRFFTSGVFAGCCQVTTDGEGMTCSMSGGYSNCDGKVRFLMRYPSCRCKMHMAFMTGLIRSSLNAMTPTERLRRRLSLEAIRHSQFRQHRSDREASFSWWLLRSTLPRAS